jgi:superfamily II DNA helicase RecQ
MLKKICSNCKIEKNITEFGKHKLHFDGLQSQCKDCKKNTDKQYYLKNRQKLIKKIKDWQNQHKPERKIYMQKYQQENKEIIKINQHNKYLKNKSKIREWSREYIRNKSHKNINFRIQRYLSNRIYYALKGICKSERTIKLLGCSVEFLKQHLQKKFTTGMSFNNYGKWHIDHIKPCAKFDLSRLSEQRKCFNYTNLQPLWAIDNIKKGSK